MFSFDPTQEYPKQTESRVIIRFQDCDPLRHLNNAKYFDYFYNAREDQIAQQYGFTPKWGYSQFQCGWVAYNSNISYIRSATFDEWVRIYSRVVGYDESSMLLEYVMTNDGGTELKTLLWSTLKYIDIGTGKKAVHQPEIVQIIEAMYDPTQAVAGLTPQERIRQLKAGLG